MIHYTSSSKKSLYNLVLNKHNNIMCDEINIISAYLGADVVKKLGEISETENIKSTIVCGWITANNKSTIDACLKHHKEYSNLKIYYNDKIHSKIYKFERKISIL